MFEIQTKLLLAGDEGLVACPACYAWLQVSAKIFLREVLEGQAVEGTAGVGGGGGDHGSGGM
jgi:hypothetical protein